MSVGSSRLDGNRALLAAATVTAVVVLAAGVLLPLAANATQPNPDHKVTLCHATQSTSNPYAQVTVDVAAVLNGGHGDHTGPLFDPSLGKQGNWGDIIPPFDFGPGEQYAGMNWTADGQATLDAGCQPTPATTTTTGGG
jgi:hypothetical protein